jgi:hypothetical protein
MSLYDAVKRFQSDSIVKELSEWKIPNSSLETSPDTWKEEINRYADSQRDVILDEIDKIGK